MNKQTQMIRNAFTKEEIREIRLALEIRLDAIFHVEGRSPASCESALDAILDADSSLRKTSKKNS